MRIIAIVAASLLATTTIANAQNYDWSGSYAGVGVEYLWSDATDVTFGGGDPNADGVRGALFAGYNYMMGGVLLGAEADISAGNNRGSNQATGGFLAPLTQGVAFSARARVGYAFEQFLPYVTAGLAVSQFEADHDNAGGASVVNETMTGYTVGAGVDAGITQNIFGRLEYRFTDYGTEPFNFFAGADIHDVNIKTQTVQIGIGFKF